MLPPREFWSSLNSLRVLYLGGNAISGKVNLTSLNGCQQLHILTLHNTPLSLIKNYRHHVVNRYMYIPTVYMGRKFRRVKFCATITPCTHKCERIVVVNCQVHSRKRKIGSSNFLFSHHFEALLWWPRCAVSKQLVDVC